MMNYNMYVVIVGSKIREPLSDLLAVLVSTFPKDKFAIVGSEEKGYQLRILGDGDEKAPRKIAEPFLKKWKPTIDPAVEEKEKSRA